MNGSVPPVVFARVGWMVYYNPDQNAAEEPVGGGSFNQEDIGSENENFRAVGDRVLGYVKTRGKKGGLNTQRLGGTLQDIAHGVLVIFVATNPDDGGQQIVGWYRDATCLSELREREKRKSGHSGFYNMEANLRNCVLLPEYARSQNVPSGLGAMGQSNTFYGDPERYEADASSWIAECVEFVRSYSGTNLLTLKAPQKTVLRHQFSDYQHAPESVATREPAPFSRDPNTLDRALSGHAKLQNSIASEAAQAGFKVLQPTTGMPDFDLGWHEGSGFTVVEVKSLSAENEDHQLRYGLGQVLHYRQQLLEYFEEVWAVLAVERAPSDERWLTLCKDFGVYLVWPATFRGLFNGE